MKKPALAKSGMSVTAALLLSACASSPPQSPDDLCDFFEEKRDWYKASKEASDRWGAPIQVPMAIMYQESAFKGKAKPPMRWFLGFIPYGRASSAYGYSQAKNGAWSDYQRETGNGWSDRDDFADAVDFVQWYVDKTNKINGVSKWDTYNQYLAYHEGNGGFKRRTYDSKPWLKKVAQKVDARAKMYGAQYSRCKTSLDRNWFMRLFF